MEGDIKILYILLLEDLQKESRGPKFDVHKSPTSESEVFPLLRCTGVILHSMYLEIRASSSEYPREPQGRGLVE